ncbi:Mitochondrial Carrier (MC) Family [Thraustotheca clavata]|uniref:Mitochondrial Carrier (MC) Family n=1 Tax=Thraustotheca clavata TaxID=74557 RepID=A0A1V9ZRK5_9STRA|nr:Mitochondrial Carrier (MC) Family [Thraustotheca clavata]
MAEAARTPLTGMQYAAIGSMAGMFEVCIQQPMMYIKNCVQQNRPMSFHPAVMYRGVGVMCASIAPVSAVQFAVDGVLTTSLNAASIPSTEGSRILTAATAGVCSSFLSSPAELVMTLQQHTGHSVKQTIQEVTQTYGFSRLYRGMPYTCLREMIWCASYLALGPVLGEKLHQHFPETFGDANTATISQRGAAAMGGSIGAGLIAVLATQPIDTIKTIMQGNALDKNAMGIMAESRRVWNQGGISGLYKGTIPRGLRLIGAVFILSETKKILEQQCHLYQEGKFALM